MTVRCVVVCDVPKLGLFCVVLPSLDCLDSSHTLAERYANPCPVSTVVALAV